MSSEKPTNISTIQQYFQRLSLGTLCKSIATSGLILFLFYTFLFNHPYYRSSNRFTLFKLKWPTSSNNTISPNITTTSTSLGHIVFGIVGSMNTWRYKKSYIEAWWRPNMTRGYLFLDRAPTKEFKPWSPSSPPFRVNEGTITKFKVNRKVLTQVRIVHTILETFRQGDKGVRWYVMADDDTVLFIDNLVEVLSKYDHTKYFYVGMNSECVKSNTDFSFDMAFGGAGYALSYPLAEALATRLDGCIDERYPYVYSSDFVLHSCLADLGVDLTRERGFHQVIDHSLDGSYCFERKPFELVRPRRSR